jgi:hypothetical protein
MEGSRIIIGLLGALLKHSTLKKDNVRSELDLNNLRETLTILFDAGWFKNRCLVNYFFIFIACNIF